MHVLLVDKNLKCMRFLFLVFFLLELFEARASILLTLTTGMSANTDIISTDSELNHKLQKNKGLHHGYVILLFQILFMLLLA